MRLASVSLPLASIDGALICGTLICGTAVPAWGYCRTTTCDTFGQCEKDENDCVIEGKALHWPGSCVSFSVHSEGSKRQGIGFDDTRAQIRGAFKRWISSKCSNGELPGVKIADLGASQCGRPEYNTDLNVPNANVWMFRDDEWPHDGMNATIALTTITFHLDTGEIFDADVEINSFAQEVTLKDDGVEFDLASIVTHEAGHFLGLSHTKVHGSAMVAGYARGSIALRKLGIDDQAGMCAIYEPRGDVAADDCKPRHGYSPFCGDSHSGGCRISASGRPGSRSKLGFLAIGLLAVGWFRRRSALE